MTSESGLHVVVDPKDTAPHAKFLADLAAQPDCVVAQITPGPKSKHRLADAVLTALGKRSDATGAGESGNVNWLRVCAWVAGEHISELVVARAHLLTRSRWEELAALSGSRLWLLVQGTAPTRGQKETLRDWPLEEVDFASFERQLGQTATRPAEPGPVRESEFPEVPDDDFPSFRAACRAQLDRQSFETVDAAFGVGRKSADELFAGEGKSIDELAEGVQALISVPSTLPQRIVLARAAQVSAFYAGFHVGVDVDALAGGYATIRRTPLTPDVAGRLRVLPHPEHAGLGLSALVSGEPPAVLARLNLGDVAEDGEHVRVKGRPREVPDYARGLLHALRLHRLTETADPEAPLFVSEARNTPGRGLARTTKHGIQQRLRRIALETGVPVASSEGLLDDDSCRWLRRRGITIALLDSGRSCSTPG